MTITELEKNIKKHIEILESNFTELENILHNTLIIKDDNFYINTRLKIFQNIFKNIEKTKIILLKEYNTYVASNKINSKVLKYFAKYPDIVESNFNKLISQNNIIANYTGITSFETLAHKIYNTYTATNNNIDFKETDYNIFKLSAIQKVLRNFINPSTPFYGLLIIHGTGVGKTCTGITIAENFKDYVKANNTKIQVIRPDEFQRQVFEISKLEQGIPEIQCTGTEYLDEFSESSDFMESIKDCQFSKNKENKDKACRKVNKVINKKIKEYYDFKSRVIWTKNIINTLNVKTKGLKGLKKQRKIIDIIRQEFNNTIIIIDEAHNLRNMDLSQTPPSDTTSKNKQTDIDNNKNTNDDDTPLNIIKVLELVLLIAQNVRIVLLSATPMYDRASDIVPLLNLLLLNDYRPRITEKDLFSDEYGSLIPNTGSKLLNKVSRGYISYVKGNDPNDFPLRLYANSTLPSNNIFKHSEYPKYDITGKKKITKTQQLKHLILVNCPLTKIHSNAIINKTSLTIDDKNNKITKLDSNDSKHKLDKSNLESQKDLDLAIQDTETDDYKYSVAYSTELQLGNYMYNTPNDVKGDFVKCYGINGFNHLFSKDKSGSYVPKTEDTLKQFMMDNLNKYGPKIKKILESIKKSTGPVAVYSNFIYGGLIPLIIALELEGYSRYDNVKEFVKYSKKPKDNKYKYVLFTGDKQLSKGGETYVNLRTNMIKEKDVKVFLFSGAGSEGLSLFGYREIHIMEPWHNINLIEQSIGRVIRNKSHHHLKPELRNVTVYMYANTFSNEFKELESIDLRIYSICEQKALAIGDVELLLKSNAFDCVVSRHNNIRDSTYFGDKIMIENSYGKKMNVSLEDLPYSRDTSYQKTSTYKCNIDLSTKYNKSSKSDSHNLLSITNNNTLGLLHTYDYEDLKDFKNMYKIEIRELKLLLLKVIKHLGNISMLDVKELVNNNLNINPRIKNKIINKIISVVLTDLQVLSRKSSILNKKNELSKLIFIHKKNISNLGTYDNFYNTDNIIIRLIPLKNYNKHLELIKQNTDTKIKQSKIKIKDNITLKMPNSSTNINNTTNQDVNLLDLIEKKKNKLLELQKKEDISLVDLFDSLQDKFNNILMHKKESKTITKFNINTNFNFDNNMKIGYLELLSAIYERFLINEKLCLIMYIVIKFKIFGLKQFTSLEKDLFKIMFSNIVLDTDISILKKIDNKSKQITSSNKYLLDDEIIYGVKPDNINGFILANDKDIKYYAINNSSKLNEGTIMSYSYLKNLFKEDKLNLDKVLKSKYNKLSQRILSNVYGYLVYEKKFQQPKFKITDYISFGFKKSVKGIFCANKQIGEINKLSNLLVPKKTVEDYKLINYKNMSKKNICGDLEMYFRLRNNYTSNSFNSKLDYGNIYFLNPENYFIWQKYNS